MWHHHCYTINNYDTGHVLHHHTCQCPLSQSPYGDIILLQLSEYFSYPNTSQTRGVRISEDALFGARKGTCAMLSRFWQPFLLLFSSHCSQKQTISWRSWRRPWEATSPECLGRTTCQRRALRRHATFWPSAAPWPVRAEPVAACDAHTHWEAWSARVHGAGCVYCCAPHSCPMLCMPFVPSVSSSYGYHYTIHSIPLQDVP